MAKKPSSLQPVPNTPAVERVSPEYQAWAWPILKGRQLEMLPLGTKFASGRLAQIKGAARIRELRPDRDNAHAVALDAFNAMILARQPLRQRDDLMNRYQSIINSIIANLRTSAENRHRHPGELEDTHSVVTDDELKGGGKRQFAPAGQDSLRAKRLEDLKLKLPEDWHMARRVIDEAGRLGTRKVDKIAFALGVVPEVVAKEFNRIRDFYEVHYPERVQAIRELAKSSSSSPCTPSRTTSNRTE